MKSRLGKCLSGVAALLMVAATPAHAQQALRVGGPAIDGVFEEGKPSPYWNFYAALAEGSPVQVDLHMMPVKRFTRAFFSREFDCMYMASDEESYYRDNGRSQSEFLHTPVFNRIDMHAYSHVSVPYVTSMAELEGKVIAGDEGLHVSSIAQNRLPFARRILYAPTMDDAFALIKNGRAQVVLSYEIDAEQYFERMGKQEFHASPDFMLLSLGEGLACWPSPEAEKFVSYAGALINNLRKSGELKSRFGFSVK